MRYNSYNFHDQKKKNIKTSYLTGNLPIYSPKKTTQFTRNSSKTIQNTKQQLKFSLYVASGRAQ